MATVKERVQRAEERTNTDPTEKQKIGGNYKKGKAIIKGLKISIENPVGSTRSGVNKDGENWSNKMPFTYGYFNGTIGKDGDPIDVYLGPIIDKDFDVFVVDQVDEETRSFDEHKVMFGFESEEQAHTAYMSCFNDGWKGFNSVTKMTLNKFKQWLKNKDAIKYPASRLNMSKKIEFKNVNNPRIKHIQLDGEVEEEKTLEDLMRQAGNEADFDTLMLEIASPGGSVSEGLLIMVWLGSLSKAGKEIITVVTANAYSIASLIMLAADTKLISKYGKVMVHNPMVPELKYANASELEKYAVELRDLESAMYALYEIFTGLNTEQIKLLMDNETYLTPDEAVSNGFADLVVDIKPKPFQMAINTKQNINMFKTLNILHKAIGMVNKSDFVNQLYYTEDGEVEIFQNDPSTYAVGDRTNIEQGEVTLSDGSKLTIKDFLIDQIDKGVEKTNVEGEPSPNETIEEVIVSEPAIAPVIEEEMAAPVKGKDEMPGKIIETTESVKSTKEIVAKSDEEVVAKADEEVVAKAEEVVAKADEKEVVAGEFNTGPAPVEDKPKAEMAPEDKQDVALILEGLQSGLQILTDKLTEVLGAQSEMKVEQSEMKAKFENMAKFEDVATEAIDALASNAASNFKPEAKVSAISKPKGSIFQSMKQKRGL